MKRLWLILAVLALSMVLVILVNSAPALTAPALSAPSSAPSASGDNVIITVTVQPEEANADEEVTYYLNYAVNEQLVPGAELRFPLPQSVQSYAGDVYTHTARFRFASHPDIYTIHNGEVVWALGDLPAGSVGQEVIIVALPRGPFDGELFETVAAFNGADDTYLEAEVPSVTIHTSPYIQLRKYTRDFGASRELGCVGQDFNYYLWIHNSGTTDLFNVVMTDTLPAGYMFVTATMPVEVSGSVLRWTIPYMRADYSYNPRHYTVKLRADPVLSGTLTNNVLTASSDQGGDIRFQHGLDLFMPWTRPQKSWPSLIRPGDTFTYCVYVQEPHQCQLNPIAITETVPSGLTVLDATQPYTQQGQQLLWRGAEPMKMYRIVAEADGDLPLGGGLENTVEASAEGAASDVLTAGAIISDQVDVEMRKWLDSRYSYRSTFYIELSNRSTAPLTNVNVVDRVPPGMLLSSADVFPDSCNPATVKIWYHTAITSTQPPLDDPGWRPYSGYGSNARWLRWEIPTLSSQRVRMKFEANHSARTSEWAENVARYQSAQGSGTASTTYRVPALFDLSTYVSPDRVSPEQSFRTYIRYRNVSNFTTTQVLITATLPTSTTFVSAADDGRYITDTHQVVWDVGALVHGQRGNLSFSAQVVRGALDRSRFCPEIVLDSAEWPSVGPVDDCTTLIGTRAFQIEKRTAARAYLPGSTVTYTIDYRNVGDVAVKPLSILDRLPDRMTLISATTPNGENLSFSDSLAPLGSPPPADDPSWRARPLSGTRWVRWQRPAPTLVDAAYAVQISLRADPDSALGTLVTNTAIITGENLPPAYVARQIMLDHPPHYIYLPLIIKPAWPDLWIRQLSVAPEAPQVDEPVTLTVVIENQGIADVTQPFWVDLYVDPAEVPEVNRTWDMVGSPYGLSWLVDGPVAAGERITLTSEVYTTTYSLWPGHFNCAGPHVLYAQVDSFNGTSAFAAILESDEANNIAGPLEVPVTCPPNATCAPVGNPQNSMMKPGPRPTPPAR